LAYLIHFNVSAGHFNLYICLILKFSLSALDSQLQLLNESLMEDPFQSSGATPAVRTWEMRHTLSDQRWDTARPQLLDLMLAADKIPDAYSKCSHCKKKQTAIRCRDCLPKQLFCSECDVNIHRHLPLHNRDSLLQGFYKPIPPTCYAAVNDDGAVSLCEQGMYDIFLNVKCMFYAL